MMKLSVCQPPGSVPLLPSDEVLKRVWSTNVRGYFVLTSHTAQENRSCEVGQALLKARSKRDYVSPRVGKKMKLEN